MKFNKRCFLIICFCLLFMCGNARAYEYETPQPMPQFYSLTGFKWNRPVAQTLCNYDISYILDETDYTTDNGLSSSEVSNALIGAFNSWEAVSTSNISFAQVSDNGGNYDYWDNGWSKGDPEINAIIGGDTSVVFPYYPWYANIIVGGWLPYNYFESLQAGGGETMLGVTISCGFAAEEGEPAIIINGIPFLDANEDGFADFAFSEIYFNDYFEWGIGVGIDIETVVLHEIGHALGLGHAITEAAVMYAGYYGIRREVHADDVAGISYLYPQSIPEPTSMVLLCGLAVGLFGIAAVRRKQ